MYFVRRRRSLVEIVVWIFFFSSLATGVKEWNRAWRSRDVLVQGQDEAS